MRWTTDVQRALDELILDRMIRLLESAVRQQPNVTASALVAELRARQTQSVLPAMDCGTCRRCGKRVVRVDHDFVTHVAEDGSVTNRGCRAATFNVDTGWDESLPRGWTATWSAGQGV